MAAPRAIARPRRADVFLVSFDPTVGAEIRKTRHALVIQNGIANRTSPITIVAAITSRFEEPTYPTEVFVRAGEGGLSVDSVVLLNQVRSIDTQRLVRRLGRLAAETMEGVDQALALSFGLVAL